MTTITATPSTMQLADGRTLAWYEFGDRNGVPCISTSGTPASGIVGVLFDEKALAAGVRWISVDKPGYGHSSLDPHRSLARYSEDIRALLDHLGLDRVVAVGESGGGPHVLALTHDLGDRVKLAVVLSGLGEASDPAVRKGMTVANRSMLFMAKRAPWAVRGAMAAMKVAFFRRKSTFLAMMIKQQPEPDKVILRTRPDAVDALFAGTTGGLRQGAKAAAMEFTMFVQPWHFALEDITVPVEIWHGTVDPNVPIRLAREMASRLPNCTTHFIEGGGHLATFDHHDEIVANVAGAFA